MFKSGVKLYQAFNYLKNLGLLVLIEYNRTET